MSLYLCIFDGNREIAGVDAGGYGDFNALRECVAKELEAESGGSRFPTLMLHSDCDGAWSAEECGRLRAELAIIIAELKEIPARPFPSAWQETVAAEAGLRPANALESFPDVEGIPLAESLDRLARLASESGRSILFQ